MSPAPARPAAPPRPAEVLANRRWRWRTRPFPHVVADRVFRDAHHRQIATTARELVQGGHLVQLERHDLLGLTLTESVAGPLRFFVSRPWHDLLASLFDVPATGFVNCGLHHHAPGSANGFPHNDLNPGWSLDEPGPDGIVLPTPARCSYTTGAVTDPADRATEAVRAIVAQV
jgi:hypothetical protein